MQTVRGGVGGTRSLKCLHSSWTVSTLRERDSVDYQNGPNGESESAEKRSYHQNNFSSRNWRSPHQQTRQPGCFSKSHTSGRIQETKSTKCPFLLCISLCELNIFELWKKGPSFFMCVVILRVLMSLIPFYACICRISQVLSELLHIHRPKLVLEPGLTHTSELTLEYMAPLSTSPLRIQMIDAAGLALSAWQVRLRGSPARRLTTGPPLMTGFSGGTETRREDTS